MSSIRGGEGVDMRGLYQVRWFKEQALTSEEKEETAVDMGTTFLKLELTKRT